MIKQDKFGPEYRVRIYDPQIGMTAFLVIDNTVLGPGKGGFRMTSTVSEEEVARLARVMTWKNALAGIPFGGAKGGIIWKGGDDELKKQFVQSFARNLKPFMPKYYISAPDVNVGEKEIEWFIEATGDFYSATGKPATMCIESAEKKRICGIPHEAGSTGFGVARATKVACECVSIAIKGASIAIDGFGNVGSFAFKYLSQMGATIVAVSDSKGAIYKKNGLDVKEVSRVKKEYGSVQKYSGAKKIKKEELFELKVDVLIPASVTDVIHDGNKKNIKARVIVEGANIPMTEKTEKFLHTKGILIVPDFVANAGGVISSYAEHKGLTHEEMFTLVQDKIEKATHAVIMQSLKTKQNPRDVGIKIAQERVQKKINFDS